ncbi:MAG: dTMP kinase [Chloroflexi bacterium]|nr:dTMP kinase [Chloroflexota bacterium]
MASKRSGCFITFEGPEGAGKSTQTQRLAKRLEQAGFPCMLTREPGGTPIGDRIRAILLDSANAGMIAEAEILLFSASRAQLVAECIRPSLAAGCSVICDRYADSTLAYQGYGRGLDLVRLREITAFATGGLTPDLTVFLDLPVIEGLKRRHLAFQGGEGELNRLDCQSLEFHERVRAGYLEMASQEQHRWVILDGMLPPDQVAAEIWAHVHPLLTYGHKGARL